MIAEIKVLFYCPCLPLTQTVNQRRLLYFKNVYRLIIGFQ